MSTSKQETDELMTRLRNQNYWRNKEKLKDDLNKAMRIATGNNQPTNDVAPGTARIIPVYHTWTSLYPDRLVRLHAYLTYKLAVLFKRTALFKQKLPVPSVHYIVDINTQRPATKINLIFAVDDEGLSFRDPK